MAPKVGNTQGNPGLLWVFSLMLGEYKNYLPKIAWVTLSIHIWYFHWWISPQDSHHCSWSVSLIRSGSMSLIGSSSVKTNPQPRYQIRIFYNVFHCFSFTATVMATCARSIPGSSAILNRSRQSWDTSRIPTCKCTFRMTNVTERQLQYKWIR